MKRILAGILLFAFASACFSQSAVIREEAAPGSYVNVQTYSQAPVTWLASAARTTTQNLTDQTNVQTSGIVVFCNVTVAPGVETLTLSFQGKDPISGVYATLSATSATTATGLITMIVGRGFATVAPSVTAVTTGTVIPNTWRLQMAHSAGSSWTYSCSYQLIQ